MAKKIDSLEMQLDKMNKSLDLILDKAEQTNKTQEFLGKSIVATIDKVEQLGKTPIPRGSAVSAIEAGLAKGGVKAGVNLTHKQFTPETKKIAMDVLLKAGEAGEISSFDSGKIESQINKSILDPNFQLDQNYIKFLQGKIK